jgi:hypothetical protein
VNDQKSIMVSRRVSRDADRQMSLGKGATTMRYSALLSLAAGSLLAGGSAAAQQAGNVQASQNPEPVVVTGQQAIHNKRVCERTVPTGSIRVQTICKTQEQWDFERTQSVAELQRISDRQRVEQQMRWNRETLLAP